MAKRICFAWREYWYDFDTEEEAKQFIKNNNYKGWFSLKTNHIKATAKK